MAHAQYAFYFNDNIPVVVNGDTLVMPWAGGLNCPQFSAIDLNGDGIKDLFVFDRDAGKVITFINSGIPGQISYRYAPQYQIKFPQGMQYWTLLADYNCDGKADIYTYNIQVGGAGITLYRNDYDNITGLHFTLVTSTIRTIWNTQNENLYVSPVNLPTMVDMDGDGDVDICSFDTQGNIIYYHQNMSLEDWGTCDSIDFKTQISCWGNCGTNSNANCFELNQQCRLDPYQMDTTVDRMKHSGGSLLALELNGNGTKSMIVGDVVSSTSCAIFNGGTPTAANIDSQDCHYPRLDTPIYIHTFPACFYVDVNNDGVRDLICAPNASGVSENTNGVWYFKNAGNESIPDFKFQTDAFLQNQMIEVGQNSMPVFVDIDGDGLKDLIIGNYGYYDTTGIYQCGLSYYRNTGTATQPAFTLITRDFAGLMQYHLNQGACATFGDIDGDGKPDMIVSDTGGISGGWIAFFKNNSATGYPMTFDNPVRTYQNIACAGYSTPQLIDVDRDGKLDLLIGNIFGKLSYYHNDGTLTNPVFNLVTANFGGVHVKQYSTGYSIPFMFDSAGSYRLMVGSERGAIYYYSNIDGNLGGNFTLLDSVFNYNSMNTFDGTRVAVFGADIDGDGKMDLITGNQLGGVNIYVTRNYSNTNSSNNIQPIAYVFPNPSANTFSIKVIGVNLSIEGLRIYDLLGQEVENIPATSTSNEITFDSRHLADGMYFGTVSLNTNQTVTVKIIVQH
jgi:hypothetical protein